MLDITLLKQNKQLLLDSEKKRFSKVDLEKIVKLDDQWRSTKHEMDTVNKTYNAICKDMGKLFKEKVKSDDILKQIEVLKASKSDIELKKKNLVVQEGQSLLELQKQWKLIGNIVHDSVPVSQDEANNKIIRKWDPKLTTVPDSDFKRPEKLLSHHQLLDLICGYAPEQGVKVAGHRGYFLTGVGCKLWRALSNFGLDFLEDKDYQQMYTPFYMKKDVMARTAQLSQFDEELYKMVGEEDAYLIATSEQPISAYHMNEWIDHQVLPIKYAGYSTCFRKEAGAHGKDTWGIFRIHQFEKIEQFILSKPEDSWDIFENMIKTAEDFYKKVFMTHVVEYSISSSRNC